MTLILIDSSTSSNQASADEVASAGLTPSDLSIRIASPDSLPAVDLGNTAEQSDDAPGKDEAEDPAQRALLFGRYSGQIKARIERAWLRPRSAIGARSFDCSVRILQDRSGNVKETMLQNCNGDARWQLSLVQAIQSASPLPAPPNPNVFADAVTLQFESSGYVEGAPANDFEPLSPSLVATKAASQSQNRFSELMRPARPVSTRGGVIDLRIEGSGHNAVPSGVGGKALEPFMSDHP